MMQSARMAPARAAANAATYPGTDVARAEESGRTVVDLGSTRGGSFRCIVVLLQRRRRADLTGPNQGNTSPSPILPLLEVKAEVGSATQVESWSIQLGVLPKI